MNKDLPNKTDNVFLHHLKNYGEEPSKNIWLAIDKKLSERNAKPSNSMLLLSTVTVILFLCMPLLLIEHSLFQFKISKQSINKNAYQYNKATNYASSVTSSIIKKPGINKVINTGDKKFMSASNSLQNDFSIAAITSSNILNKFLSAGKQRELNNTHLLKFFKDDADNKKSNSSKIASTIITLHNKHNFSLMPFFSADHISGRFIEQYEFDNLSKDDYDKRERPDMSFTSGVLGAYQLNKKFSLVSGISFSSSNLSITTTAVKALSDASGVYKFKLATSYGFAEIAKSGITPNAGDSLLVSSASMQFNYVSFPLLINYNIGGKKIKYSVHSGFAINKLLSEKVKAEYEVQNNDEAETINKIEGIRKTFFTLNTGFEAKYSLNRKTDISISPELRYGINSINKGTPIRTYPVNYGVSLNLNFKL